MPDVPFAPGWDLERSPFHDGELAVQERVGVREKIAINARRAVRRYLTDQHRAFFPMLPYIFVGSVDAAGRPWASLLMGPPGFVGAPDAHTLLVRARPLHGDPLRENLLDGAELAILGVELHTRRRNRAIGTAAAVGPDGFRLQVRQTLGICPQYIQGRQSTFTSDPMTPPIRPLHRSDALDAASHAIISRADTYMVASVSPRERDDVAGGVDVSHRGGLPGFVRIDDEQTLTAPDFVGNFMFNTIGNWQIDNRAGLLFVDFDGGSLVYIAARAEIIWDDPQVRAFAGAQRLVRYHIEQVIRVENSLPARFTAPQNSPLLARTGTWDAVAETLAAERSRNEWRRYRIAKIEDESAVIRSFYLEAVDGGGLAGYASGQFLPVRVHPEGWAAPATRTYTLSAAPDGSRYRISVKREGKGGISDWLHDHAAMGTLVEALAPRGTFTFKADPQRPVVLISAGVGITPMIAMLDSLLVNDGRTRHHAPIRFIHAARNSATHAFAAYLKAKTVLHANLQAHIRYSRPLAGDAIGRTHDSEGVIDLPLLKSILPFDDHEFYLCGPAELVQGLYDGLTGLGVRDKRIHFESFGPASVTRRSAMPSAHGESEEAVVVTFARSGKTVRWSRDQGSLLDLAERAGLQTVASCRSGVCGACATRVLAGSADYGEPPVFAVEEGEALICCSTPHPGPHLDNSKDREGISLDL